MSVRVVTTADENFTLPPEVLTALDRRRPVAAGWTARGPWDTATLYALGDVVSHDGSLYLAKYPNGNLAGDKNVTFETGIAGWGDATYGALSSWSVYSHTGSHSLQLTSLRSGAVSGGYEYPLVLPGALHAATEYTFACWMYTETDPAQLTASIEMYQIPGSTQVDLVFGTWTKVARTFTTPGVAGDPDTNFHALPTFAATAAGQVVYVDDVTLFEGTVSAPITGAPFDPALWTLIYPAPAASGGGGMTYRGGYAPGPYAVGDVVTDSGQLVICTTAYTAVGSTPAIVGARTAGFYGSDTSHVLLPTGSVVGDLALVLTTRYMPPPAGATTVFTVTPPSWVPITLSSKVLTSSDISAGQLNGSYANSDPNSDSATITVVRGIQSIGIPVTSVGTLVEGAITPTGPAYLLHTLGSELGGTTTVSGDPLTAFVKVDSGTYEGSAASGIELYTSGPVTPRTWARTGTQNPEHTVTGVIPLYLGGRDLSKWDRLA